MRNAIFFYVLSSGCDWGYVILIGGPEMSLNEIRFNEFGVIFIVRLGLEVTF